jgi:hypothetical protein
MSSSARAVDADTFSADLPPDADDVGDPKLDDFRGFLAWAAAR